MEEDGPRRHFYHCVWQQARGLLVVHGSLLVLYVLPSITLIWLLLTPYALAWSCLMLYHAVEEHGAVIVKLSIGHAFRYSIVKHKSNADFSLLLSRIIPSPNNSSQVEFPVL